MQFTLNGELKSYSGDPELSLLKWLREHEHITSAKDGCTPQAACGCCAVEMNGRAVLSCAITMKKAANSQIKTVEGIDQQKQETFARAFVTKSGVQCGFCTPGIVMQAKVLIDKNPSPTRAEVQKALTPHLCRCTGYKKIEDSILFAAEAIRENKSIPKPASSGVVGAKQPKYDAENLVLGQRPFVADMHFEGMLFGVLVFSEHPRAKVLAIDTQAAEQLPGVKRVFTAKDIPGDRYIGLIRQDWPLMIALSEDTRCVSDVLAGIVADSEETARQAAELVKIEYQVKPPLTDPNLALKPDALPLHETGNLLSDTVIDRGSTDQAIKEAAFVSNGFYKTQMIEHGYLETECCIAMPDEEGLKVYSQGQGVYEDQKQIAKLLGKPLDHVSVELVPNGGGFGGKEDLTVQGHAALFSHALQSPVKVSLTRDESIRMHPKRHPVEMDYTVGCDKNGMLTVVKANIIGDTGAYASVGMKVMERAAGHATGAYNVPNVHIISKAAYTNNIPCGAMRGFGVNQVTFALEGCIDDLCEQGGFDRWQFRYDNALIDGHQTSTGQIIPGGCGLRDTLLAVKDTFNNAKYTGIACGLKNTGIGNGMADEGIVKISVVSKDKVILDHGWTEMGQGVFTMAVQFLCEETGINPDIVEVRVNTRSGAYAGMTTASRATSIIGNSIINASKDFKKDLQTSSLADLVGKIYTGEWICDWTTTPGADVEKIVTHYSYSYATQVVVLDEDGNVETVYAAHDAGRIINPNLFEGQIEGSVHMGLGYALTEELVLEDGVPKSTRLRKCGILRAKETPNIVVIGVEKADLYGPHGAKGVGEIGLVPTAGAVANAFYQYDGTRYFQLPIKIRKQK